MRRLFGCLSLGALILLLTAGSVAAQATAQLSGTVRDESGAVLPGVDRHRHANRYRLRTNGRDRRERQLRDAESADRSVPAGSLAGGIPNLRADRNRAAGCRDARHQYGSGGRQRRGNGGGGGRGPARGRAQRRHQRRRRERAHHGAAASGTPGHRPPRSGWRCRPDRHPAARRSRRRVDLGRRRPAVWRRLHARRRDAQQPADQRQPAAAVPRRVAGIPGRDQRAFRRERHALGGQCQCGHQVGHQPPGRERVRVPPGSPVQCEEPLCPYWS